MNRMSRAIMRTGTVIAGLVVMGAFVLSPVPAQASLSGKVLIWGPSVSGGGSSVEASRAAALGLTVEVVDNATWLAKTAADFAEYRALVIGDPTCGPASRNAFFSTIEANKSVWSSVVDGNVIINGTDPVFHLTLGGRLGGGTMVERGIAFAADVPGRTGLYVSLSCAFHDTAPLNVDFLSPFGTFQMQGVGCFNDAHIVATHPSLVGLTDAALSGWSCSVHEAFIQQPSDFAVLAIARNASPAIYTAADGTKGLPYIVARGEGLSASDISLTPAVQSLDVSGTSALTALVSSGGSPLAGEIVDFSVLAGPNAGLSGSAVTAPDGTAGFGYPGTIPGTDTVRASFTRGGFTQLSNVATVEWTRTVVDTPPTITVDTAAPAGLEGHPIAINTTVSDDHGPLSYSWTSGSLGALDAGAACSFAPADAEDTAITCTDDSNGGAVEAVLTVSDGVNPPVSQSVPVSIANAAPVVTATDVVGGTQVACIEGNSVTVSFAATDDGANDTHSGLIAWGDGTTSPGFSASHTYSAGSYTVSVKATDDDGDSSSTVVGTSTALVSLLFSSTGIQQPINADGTSNFKLGSTIPVKITVTDCHGTPVNTLAPNVALTKVGVASGDVNEVVSSSAADTGATMRSAGDGKYIYNLSTKRSQFNAGQDLTAGRYRLTLTSPQLAPTVVYFDLKP